MDMLMIIKFILLTFIVSAGIILFLRWQLFSSTEGAVSRLNEEISKANAKQAELNEKMRKADEEFKRRQADAKELADKMRSEAETETKEERNKIIAKAREEGEAIIEKAQEATERMKLELEKEMDIRAVRFAMQILNKILSDKAKGILDEIFINEFIEKLNGIDMSRIGSDINSIQLISLNSIDSSLKMKISKLLKEKIGRELEVVTSSDPNMGGGVVIKFGSMALDGSVANAIREVGVVLQEEIENKK